MLLLGLVIPFIVARSRRWVLDNLGSPLPLLVSIFNHRWCRASNILLNLENVGKRSWFGPRGCTDALSCARFVGSMYRHGTSSIFTNCVCLECNLWRCSLRNDLRGYPIASRCKRLVRVRSMANLLVDVCSFIWQLDNLVRTIRSSTNRRNRWTGAAGACFASSVIRRSCSVTRRPVNSNVRRHGAGGGC
jgi:hypothetical protein